MTGKGKASTKILADGAVQDLAAIIREATVARSLDAVENLEWLKTNMPPYFFITMKEEMDAMLTLVQTLRLVPRQIKVNLLEQPNKLILARQDLPGSLYDTLKSMQDRPISYAEMTHSQKPLADGEHELEVQKFEFNLKSPDEIASAGPPKLPQGYIRPISTAMSKHYPDFDMSEFKDLLWLLWLNNPDYVTVSPSVRVARLLWLHQKCKQHGGLYLDVEPITDGDEKARLLFAVGNPPQSGYLAQTMEVFNRLEISVRRLYALSVTSKYHGYFLGSFYVTARDNARIEKDSDRFKQLQTELYNTQILSPLSDTYRVFVPERILTGEETSLVNAFIGFCHTTLAHNQPDRFYLDEVQGAFQHQPGMTRRFLNLFRVKFEPGLKDRDKAFQKALKETREAVEHFNTGHRRLDLTRRAVYRACLLFIEHTYKTNFFVPEKHALAFRLNPAYLMELGEEFTEDLPRVIPFRITFFFGRHGLGYHVGFSDIARGGWRTIICRERDDYITNTSTLFREVYVLAHTQHLKNKDIYEGGSKLTVVLDAVELKDESAVTQRLYKLQYGFTNAFMDIFVTKDGKTAHPQVVDYYQDDEPIEIGPDENMHDAMIEEIARIAVRRGYVLGIGIMSSKSVGINHKEYGVTSRGVMRFADVAMKQVGINIEKDPFTIKMTGGPFGDVAGNCMKLILERCPKAAIKSITDGTGALFDPQGVNHKALSEIVLKHDVAAFNPEKLNPGGYLLLRHETRKEALRDLYKKIECTDKGLKEHWITSDELQTEFGRLLFDIQTDLFLPCGGRPETIDHTNWQRLFDKNKHPSARVIVEGANSFITPAAREQIQKQGVILMRDASANKCGVISSSYEIIANLLMSEKEFLKYKEAYVNDVLRILEKRAAEEASLIFRRHDDQEEKQLFTEISAELSTEINDHYTRLFAFFSERPNLADKQVFQKTILDHLPAFIRDQAKYRARIKDLPLKIKFAILASEISTRIVYRGDWETDMETRLISYLKQPGAAG
jgi:glutamate dehydrogenase